MMDLINFYAIPALLTGSIYALGAIGITLIFSVFRFANIAHGDMATLGAFVVLTGVQFFGLSPYLALPFGMIVMAAIAIGCHQAFFEYLSARPKIVTVIASLGLALMLRSIVQVFWGVDPETYVKGIEFSKSYGGFKLKAREIITLTTTLGLALALAFFLTRTKWGKAMRAYADNPDLAALSGIDHRLVTVITWAIAGGLITASGFFLGLNNQLTSMMGWYLLLPMFAAAIVGGVGSVAGALIGGFIIGFAEEFSVLFLPTQYKAATAFVLLLIVLVLRPQGLFRGKVL